MTDTPSAPAQTIDLVLIETLSQLARATAQEGNAAIAAALAQVGQVMQVDRALLFWADAKGHFTLDLDWAEDGITPAHQVIGTVRFEMSDIWQKTLLQDRLLLIHDIDGMPDELAIERASLQRANVLAVIMVPILQGEQIIGTVSFDMVRQRRDFAPEVVRGLQALASGVGGLRLRMRAEQELRESRDQLAATLRAMPDLIIELDQGHVVRAVHLADDASELEPPQKLVGRPLRDSLPPDTAALAQEMIAQVDSCQSCEPRRYSLAVGGGQRWFEARLAKWGGDDGGYVFIIRDITRDKQIAEREEARLRQLQQIFDHAPIGIALSDLKTGRFLDANPAFLEASGYDRDKFCTLTFAEVTDEAGLAEALTHVDELRRTGRYGPIDQQYFRADGSVAQIVLRGVVAQDHAGSTAIWHFVDDQTARLAHEAEIVARRMEAEAARFQLLAAVEALTDGFALYDADQRLVLSNQQFRRDFRRSGDLVKPGMHFMDILQLRLDHQEYPSAIGREASWLAERRARLDMDEVESLQQLESGRWIWTVEKRTPDGGRVVLGSDVTELREAQQRLEHVIDAAHIGTWEWDIPRRLTKVNHLWHDMLGLSPSEGYLTSEYFTSLLHPDDRADMIAHLERIQRGVQDNLEVTIRLKHAEDYWVWVLFRGQVIQRDATGQPHQMSGIALDVSPQVAREQALIATRDALQSALAARDIAERAAKSARDRLVAAVEALQDGFVLFDSDDRLVIANARYREFFPRFAAFLQEGDTFLSVLQRAAYTGEIADAVDDPEGWIKARMAQHITANETLEQRLSDGRVLRIYETPTPDGGRVGLRTDVTELYNALDRAEAASRTKSAFLANMSHEIRTPMNGILGMAELLAQTPLSDDQARKLQTIRQSGDALLGILNDILDLARIEAGKLSIESRPLDIVKALTRQQALLRIAAEAKGLELTLDIQGADKAMRLGDETRLGQIVANLASNAIKFTEHGQVAIRLSCEDADQITIELSDSGIGMTEAQLTRVFEEFEQADSSITRRFGGSGLGLSIVRRIVDLMGGTISATSTPGRGTCMVVTLPLPLTTLDDGNDLLPPDLAMPDTLRLLVAEDNITNTTILKAMLDARGIQATYVSNGQEALDVWAPGRFDLLLLDIAMPVMDGIEALRHITEKAQAAGGPTPYAIAATANVMQDQVASYLEAGFSAVLGKPYKSAELFALLARLSHEMGEKSMRTPKPTSDI